MNTGPQQPRTTQLAQSKGSITPINLPQSGTTTTSSSTIQNKTRYDPANQYKLSSGTVIDFNLSKLNKHNSCQGEIVISTSEIKLTFIIEDKIASNKDRWINFIKPIKEALTELQSIPPNDDRYVELSSKAFELISNVSHVDKHKIEFPLVEKIKGLVDHHNNNLIINSSTLTLIDPLPQDEAQLADFTKQVLKNSWQMELIRDNTAGDQLNRLKIVSNRSCLSSGVTIKAYSTDTQIPNQIIVQSVDTEGSIPKKDKVIKVGASNLEVGIEALVCSKGEKIDDYLDVIERFSSLFAVDRIDPANGESLVQNSNLVRELLYGDDFKLTSVTNLEFNQIDMLAKEYVDVEFIGCKFDHCIGTMSVNNLTMQDCAIIESHFIFCESNNFQFLGGYCDEASSISGQMRNSVICPKRFSGNLLGITDLSGTTFTTGPKERVADCYLQIKIRPSLISSSNEKGEALNSSFVENLSSITTSEINNWESKGWLNLDALRQRIERQGIFVYSNPKPFHSPISQEVTRKFLHLRENDTIPSLPSHYVEIKKANSPDSDQVFLFYFNTAPLKWTPISGTWRNSDHFRQIHIDQLISKLEEVVKSWSLFYIGYEDLKNSLELLNMATQKWKTSPHNESCDSFEFADLTKASCVHIPKIIKHFRQIKKELGDRLEDRAWINGDLSEIEPHWGYLESISQELNLAEKAIKSIVVDMQIEERLIGIDEKFEDMPWIFNAKSYVDDYGVRKPAVTSRLNRYLTRLIPWSKLHRREAARDKFYRNTRITTSGRANFTSVLVRNPADCATPILMQINNQGCPVLSIPEPDNNNKKLSRANKSFKNTPTSLDLLYELTLLQKPGWKKISPRELSNLDSATIQN